MKSCAYRVAFSIVCRSCLISLSTSGVAQAAFTNQAASILGGVNYESRSASVADIDDDGDLDLLFQGATLFPSGTVARQLFRNNTIGTGTLDFTNVSSMLPSGLGDSWSAARGDYNGDGRVDVFVGQTNSGATGDVVRNDGAAFSNQSAATGLNDPGFHQNVAWNDIDNDRDLDLIICMEGPEKHQIYLQDPSGSFTPVGAAVGFQAADGTRGYGMAIGDTDGDGDLDIYISTCRGDNNIRNNFYENQLVETGALGFVDIADTNGTQNMTNSYGAEFHDFDDDGKLDLFMVGADGQPTKMWRNDGNNQFTDVDTVTGHPLLSSVGGDFNGSRAVDYDNDGDLDLFLHDKLPRATINQARWLYRNDGNWQFTDVTGAEGISATNEGAHDSTWADIDLDGDQDLIAPTSGSFPERVFISDAAENGNHWLYIELDGPTYNTTGIGASVYATLNEGTPQELTLRREANTNAGTFNQSDLPVHFGLGSTTEIDQLRIVWPDGTVQFLYNVSADQYITIDFANGDFNADGVVDAADYVAWRRDDGTQAGYDTWRANLGDTSSSGFGSAGSGGQNAVPEPGTTWLLFTGIALWVAPVLEPVRRSRNKF